MKNKLPPRHTAILVGSDDWLERQVSDFCTQRQCAVRLNQQNFAKAKNLLGQEFDFILYDARQAFNLEALAIAGGTLKAGGVLLLLFNQWQHLGAQKDNDSLRWSGEKQAISTPHFTAFFQKKVTEYAIPLYIEACFPLINLPFIARSSSESSHSIKPTTQQTQIIDEILRRQAEIYIVTAKRGRGKSALAGWLARALSQSQRVFLTAPNKSAVKILQDFAQNETVFIAPDELCSLIRQQPEHFSNDWLLIDEAAMIPLELLNCLTSTFKHILCTTTIHSYEGTGRGFLLKFITNLNRTFRCFELHSPLRWAEDDPLERFIEDLLLLDCEDRLPQPPYNAESEINIQRLSQQALTASGKQADFYALLTLSHYRTTPLDLRRLFDAPRQGFWLAEEREALLGCVWTLEEGGLQDAALIADICRGLRRPPGNLAAQALAFQSNLPQACALKSVRISRVAVQPNWQRHGIGKRLINAVVKNAEADFVSVSFGYTKALAEFWHKCGFVLVHLGEHKEASSGCYSAIALHPISTDGGHLAEKALTHFQRNMALSFHPLAAQFGFTADWRLNEDDRRILQNFANFNRTLSASLGAVRRLLAITEADDSPLLRDYCAHNGCVANTPYSKKDWLQACRAEVGKMLQKY